jgi:ethanolamine utilization protein EutM
MGIVPIIHRYLSNMSMPQSKAGAKKMNGNALGLIETLGLVGLITAVDAMLKAASVELASSVIKLDGGIVSVMVRGDVSSVRAAVEAGAEAAARVGELKAAHVIPRPDHAVTSTFGGGSAA